MKQKILVFTIGFIATILLSEIFLFTLGHFYKSSHQDIHKDSKSKDTFNILCLGNSFTFGGGAKRGESYPDHLQYLFNKEFNNDKVRVFNKGINCINTADLLLKLESLIDETDADFIILRAGGPNKDNKHNYDNYLTRLGQLSDRSHWSYSISNILYLSRTYNLLSLLIKRHFNKKPDLLYDSKDISYQEKLEENVGFFHSRYGPLFWDNSFQSVTAKRAHKEIKFLNNFIKKDPDPTAYLWLSNWHGYFFNNHLKAANTAMMGIKVAPHYWNNWNYAALNEILKVAKDNQKVVDIINKFKSSWKKKYPSEAYRLDTVKKEDVGKWIESDVTEMIKIIRNRNIPVILQNYPPWIPPVCSRRPVSQSLRNVAKSTNVPFIDLENIFLEMFENGEEKDKYYANIMGKYEGHTNSKGYFVNAEHLYNKILKMVPREKFGNKVEAD